MSRDSQEHSAPTPDNNIDRSPPVAPPVFHSEPFSGAQHPYADMMPRRTAQADVQPEVYSPPAGADSSPRLFSDAYAMAPSGGGNFEMPAPIQRVMDAGRPVHFSSAGENAANHREPDYFFTPEGKLVPNPKATPSPDGSINIEIQNKENANKSLREAILHESEMQKAAAKDMIRLWQKDHPGQPVPAWMDDLANAQPNLPDFAPFSPTPETPVTPPPENGFVNRGVSGGGYNGGGGGGGGGGDGGFSGFAGNGGFDNQGYFRGNGSSGDGVLNTGGSDSHGQPLGPGETVKAKEIFDYMTEKYGLSPAIASGILGNMQTESSFKTNAYNKGEGAIGLCQWEGGRRTNLENFAKQEGKPVTDWHVQVDFMMHELKTSEKGAWNQLQNATTPQQAAAVFDKYYERSSGEARGQRMANAANIHQQLA